MRNLEVVADRFSLEQVAGSGGMGMVYRALDRHTGSAVALKTLRADKQSAERFAREARVLSELQHPGIVRYIAHGETPGGTPYLAMEWLDGEDLAQRLVRAPLGINESVRLMRHAADALGAAHARGV